MAPETLIFMPNGDVTLTLTRHILEEEDPEIAVEDEQMRNVPAFEPEVVAEPEPEELEDDSLFFAPDAPDSETFYPPTRRARGSDASSRRDRSTSPPASFWAQLKRQQAQMGEPSQDEKPATETKPVKKERTVLSSHEVHCIVSSRHMMLASRYFEKLLSGNSKEATTLRSTRHVSIPLSADLDAMIVLLNIVHGVSRKVPRQVKLDTLSKLAMLVSVFGMIDAVQFFSDTWIDDFQRKGLPQSYDEKVLSLLFVFWVFDRPAEFKNMSRITQRECDENLDEDAQNVPIPRNIIDAIKRDREFAMESAIAVIHTLINKYLDGQTICDGAWEEEYAYACDATVLGSLMKSSRKIGIWPKPEAPFTGKKFKNLAAAIRGIKILDVCKKSSSRRLHLLGPSNNSHGLEDSIEAAMKGIEAGMDGLELTEYAKSDDFGNMFHPAHSDDQLELDEPINEPVEEDLPLYMKEKVEEPRREYSVSPPAVSARQSRRDLEAVAPKEVSMVPREHSRDSAKREVFSPASESPEKTSEPIFGNGHTISKHSRDSVKHDVYSSAREDLKETREFKLGNSNTISQHFRDSGERNIHTSERESAEGKDSREPSIGNGYTNPRRSRESVEQDVYAPARNDSQETRDSIVGNGHEKPRTSWIPEAKQSIYQTERTNHPNSRKQDKDEPVDTVNERSDPVSANPWDQQLKEALRAQRRSSSTESRTRGAKASIAEQPAAVSRNSWHYEVKEPVVEQRQASPSDSWNMRTPSNGVARSPVEQSVPKSEETRAYPEVRTNSNGLYSREEVKQFSQESQPAPRNSSAERVKTLADRSLHRTPSFHKSPEEVKTQQQPAPSRTNSTEEVKVLSDKRPNTTTSYPNGLVKSSVPAAAMPARVTSNEQNRGSSDRKSKSANPFTSTFKNDAKSPLSQPPITPSILALDDAMEDRKTNSSTQSSSTTNETRSSTSQQSSTPRVPSREEVAALTSKKLNTTSYFQIPSKEETKISVQPSQVAPRTKSSEEVTKLKITPQVPQVSRVEKEEVKPTIEVRATTNDALSPTEDEAAVAPQKFNMRKSKKKFQAKY